MASTTTPPTTNGGASDRATHAAAMTALRTPPPAPLPRKPGTFKRWLVVALAAASIVGAFTAYRYFASYGHAPRYRVVRVERGPLSASVSATGNLNAVTMVLVGSQVSGTIKELHADFNTVVRTGQVIARIDPALFEAAVGQARADLKSARSTVRNREAQVEQAVTNVENAQAGYAEAKAQTAKALVSVVDTRRTLARQTALFQGGLVAAADRDSAQTAYDAAVSQHESAQAHEQAQASAIRTAEAQLHVQQAELQASRDQVEQKEAALAQAQINLDHTTIRSPVDGVVVNRAVDVGQTVAATLQAPTLFTIAQDVTSMQVETSVDEADIGRIRTDTPVTFTVDAFPGETFPGTVSQIRKAPQVAQNVVTYIVVVAVANPTGKLLPGMTANVKFVTAQKGDVLKVPNTALRFRPPGAAVPATVWVLGHDGRPAPVQLTLGITDGTFTEVVRGELNAGQEVLVGLESTAPAATPGTAPALRF